MKMLMLKKPSGFTIVELLVIIAVIGILASIAVVAYNGMQARGRDAARRSDLARAADALGVHFADTGNFVESGSGCGSGGNGAGWFSFSNGSTYPRSVVDCLKDSGHLTEETKDPLGPDVSSTPTNNNYAYMKYHCGSGTSKRAFVYAKLETLPQSATATDGTCAASADTSQGMNYYVEVK